MFLEDSGQICLNFRCPTFKNIDSSRIFPEFFNYPTEAMDSDICCTLLPSNKKWKQHFIEKSCEFVFQIV